MWWVDSKVRLRRSSTKEHQRHHHTLGVTRRSARTFCRGDVDDYHMLFRRYFFTRFLTHLLSVIKRFSLISNSTASTAAANFSSLATHTYTISYTVAINLRTKNYSYRSETSYFYSSTQRLLRRRNSRTCSPILLLLVQFVWILPYLFFANYLERSLLPFRLMCYVDPDLLSVQRSLRINPQHCIQHFFTNREKPGHCALKHPLQTLLSPHAVVRSFNNHQLRVKGRQLRRVLVVRSAPRHSSYRNYIRATWKRDVEPDIPVVFVSGRDNYDLRGESEKFDDILQFDFEDSYQNLTMKMMGIYRFFLETTNVEQIVVINDDTIVNATGLKRVFERRQAADTEQYYDIYNNGDYDENNGKAYARNVDEEPLYLIGKVSRGYPRLFFPWLPWYVPSHSYPHKCYPPFVQGSSFVISRAAAARILDRICDFPSIHLDDVMMGIITNCLNIRNIHHEGFDRHLTDDFIVFHYQFSRYSADKMHNLYKKVKGLL